MTQLPKGRLGARLKEYERVLHQAKESAVLLAAFELELFERVLEHPLSAKTLAQQTMTHPARLEVVLEALCALGFLIRDAEGYGLSPLDRELFGREGADRWLPDFRLFGDSVDRKVNFVSTLRLAPEDPPPSLKRPTDDPFRFLRRLHHRQQESAREVAAILAQEPFAEVLDLGCGGGTYGIEALKRRDDANATLVDRPENMALIDALATSEGVGRRVNIRGMDFLSGDYGRGYDLVLLSNIIHCYDERENQRTLAGLFKRMNPRGRIAIKDASWDGAGGPPRASVWLSLHLLQEEAGAVHPETDVVEWLRHAGFRYEITYGLRAAPHDYLIVARKD